MPQGTVVLAGSLPVQGLALDQLVAEFGWSLKQACDLRQLSELNAHQKVVAVLFDPRDLALSWDAALRAILDAAPGTLPIVCHGFADAIEWPQVAEAGGFHSLFLPFSRSELRQSLGFVWDANCRAATISICHHPHSRRGVREQSLRGELRTARIVA
jgi:DNA-binding NtrC family response regulator